MSGKESQGGYCSATATDQEAFKKEIKKPLLKTSDLFATCNLPERFEHPHWFNGYGSQTNTQHPLYTTSANEYGWYPPGYHSVPNVYFPANQSFSRKLTEAGYHSVSSVFYPMGQTFTNRLAAAGMYRNYSLNTGMD